MSFGLEADCPAHLFRPCPAPLLPDGKPFRVHGFLGAFERAANRYGAMLRALTEIRIDLVALDPSMPLNDRADGPRTA